jgi:hypothetical protein
VNLRRPNYSSIGESDAEGALSNDQSTLPLLCFDMLIQYQSQSTVIPPG